MPHPFTMSQYASRDSLKQDPEVTKAVGGVSAYAAAGFAAGIYGAAVDPVIGAIGRDYKKSQVVKMLKDGGFTVSSVKSAQRQSAAGLNPGMATMARHTSTDPYKIIATKGDTSEIIDTSQYFEGTKVQGVADSINFLFNSMTGQEQTELRPMYKMAYEIGQYANIFKATQKLVAKGMQHIPLKSVGIVDVPLVASTTSTAASASLLQELSQSFAEDKDVEWKDVLTTTGFAAAFSIAGGIPSKMKEAFYIRDLVNKNPAILEVMTPDEINTVISAGKAFANNMKFVATGKGSPGLAEEAWNLAYKRPLQKILNDKIIPGFKASGIKPDFAAGQLAVDEIARQSGLVLPGKSRVIVTPQPKQNLIAGYRRNLITPIHEEAMVMSKLSPPNPVAIPPNIDVAKGKLEKSANILTEITDMTPEQVRHYVMDWGAFQAEDTALPRRGKYDKIIKAEPFGAVDYLTPRWYAHRKLGIDSLVESTVTGMNNRNYVQGKIQPFINNLYKYLNKNESFKNRLTANLSNTPTKNVKDFANMLDAYEWAPDFMEPQDAEIFNQTRSLFRFFIDSANVGRMQAGLPPITTVKEYLPHYLDGVAESMMDGTFPQASKGLNTIASSIPAGPHNRSAIKRQLLDKLNKHFNRNVPELLNMNMHYHLTDFYVTKPYNDLKHAVTQLEQLTIDGEPLIPRGTVNELVHFMTTDVMGWQTELDAAMDVTLKGINKRLGVEKILKTFGRHLDSPVKVGSKVGRGMLIHGALGGNLGIFYRNINQRFLTTSFYRYRDLMGAQAYIVPHIGKKGQTIGITTWPAMKHPTSGETVNMKDFLQTTNWYENAIGRATELDIANNNAALRKTGKALMFPMTVSHRSNVNVTLITAFNHAKRMIAWSNNKESKLYKIAQEHAAREVARDAIQTARFENITDPTKLEKYKKNYFKKNYPKVLDSKLWHESEMEEYLKEGMRLTQWDYSWYGMPIIARGDVMKSMNALQSWWQNWWTVHASEMVHRTITGETTTGKVIEPSARGRAFKSIPVLHGMFMNALKIVGMGATGVISYNLSKTLFPLPNGAPPYLEVGAALMNTFTAKTPEEKELAKQEFIRAWTLFVPGQAAKRDIESIQSGEKSLPEVLLRSGKKKK